MTTLTTDDKQFLMKMQKQKENNRLRQQKYLNKVKDNKEFKQQKAEYQRQYRKQLKDKFNELQGIIETKQVGAPQPININEITASKPISRRQKIYNKKQNIITAEITPKHKNREQPLEQSTINIYLEKLNIIHKHLTNTPLSSKLKQELTKLLNGNPSITNYIILNMPYLNDIEKTIQDLRQIYPNDNSFKSYLIPLTVELSHLPTLNNQYQIITKVAKNINDIVQTKRESNILPKSDEIKIIDLNKNIILSNLKKLPNIEDRLIYGLYTLFPSRREDDYRLMRLTYDKNANDLDKDFNYLQNLKDGTYKFIFNQFKTKKTYTKNGGQIFKVPDDLQAIITEYVNDKQIKENEYLFYSHNNHKELIAQSNFSAKISNTFKKIYGVPISIRFIRKSHATYIYKEEFNNKMTSAQVKEYREKMAHSANESDNYRVKGYE